MGKYIRVIVILILLGGSFLVYQWLQSPISRSEERGDVIITNDSPQEVQEQETVEDQKDEYVKTLDASAITGLPCVNYDARPLAIVYSGDVETRPYFSGINQAGFVVEMDHRYTHGGTRVMGVFECEKPEFVGPMRSGRVDFLTVAASFNAIYVPWGGDSISKSLLKKRVHDHIDCNSEIAPGGSSASCFRQSTSIVPLGGEDRAFSSAVELQEQAADLGYSMKNSFVGYKHAPDISPDQRPSGGTLTIGYMNGFGVSYKYNRDTNSYERFFAGKAEYDFTTKQRVAPKNVVVLTAKKSSFVQGVQYPTDPWEGMEAKYLQNDSGQYPNFNIGDAWFDADRSGQAVIYSNGQETDGSWKKGNDARDPYVFFSDSGEEITFVPGQIWLQIVDADRAVQWDVR